MNRPSFTRTIRNSTLAVVLGLCGTLSAQTAELFVGTASGLPNTTVDVSIEVAISNAADGFSLGVLHRSTDISPASVVPGTDVDALVDNPATDASPTGADFFSVDLAPDLNGDGTIAGGWTLGVIFDFDLDQTDPNDDPVRLPANAPNNPRHQLALATYLIAADAPAGVVPLEASAALGNPPVDLLAVLTTDGIDPIEVSLVPTNGQITILNDPFIRGDVNDDGTISLIDGVLLLYRLFAIQPDGTCPDAEDINNDETRSISDVMFLFQYLYASGAAPVNVGVCVDDPPPGVETDNLGCAASSCVP